jgi:hypothetical protein
MAWVKYPFRVKCDGVYYAPFEPVFVEDLEAALARGAEAVVNAPTRDSDVQTSNDTAKVEKPVRRAGRPKKTAK